METFYFVGAVIVTLVGLDLYRRWKAGVRPAISGTIRGTGTFDFEIVGESNHQRALGRLAGGRSRDGAEVSTFALLVMDDRNPHDSKAVAVEIDGFVVGYLNRQNAREYRAEISRWGKPGALFACAALIVGGWDRGNGDRGQFGVKLDLPLKS